jgi:hypothetical protein
MDQCLQTNCTTMSHRAAYPVSTARFVDHPMRSRARGFNTHTIFFKSLKLCCQTGRANSKLSSVPGPHSSLDTMQMFHLLRQWGRTLR